MSIPSMDTLDPTLVLILNTLSKENGLKTWNLQPEFGGTLCVRIRFNGKDGGSPATQMDGNFPNSKTKHNFNRAHKWKLNQANGFMSQSSPQLTQQNGKIESNVNSIELPRNESFSEKDSARVLFDISAVDPAVIAFDQAEQSTSDSPSIQAETTVSASLDPNRVFTATTDHTTEPNHSNLQSTIVEMPHIESGTKTENESLHECPSPPPSFDPYDNDNESVYSDSAPHMNAWPEYKKPCEKPGCFYFPRTDLTESEMNIQLGARPNGSFEFHHKCDKCGRKICNRCLWWKRRHLNHMKHVRDIRRRGPSDLVDLQNLINGIF